MNYNQNPDQLTKEDIEKYKKLILNGNIYNCKCGNNCFNSSDILIKTDKLLAGSEKDIYTPFKILTCTKCGEMVEDLLPAIVKSKIKNEKTTTI